MFPAPDHMPEKEAEDGDDVETPFGREHRKWRCRRCKAVFPRMPEGYCPACHRSARFLSVTVDRDERGREVVVAEGEIVPAHMAVSRASTDPRRARRPCGLPGIDYIFGGGLPTTGTVLLAAREGCGKSTLVIDTLFRRIATSMRLRTLYIACEQTTQDLGDQFRWLRPLPRQNMGLVHLTDAEEILETMSRSRAQFVAIDSLHAVENVYDDEGYNLSSGSPSAAKRFALELRKHVTDHPKLVLVIGQVSNDGTIKGGTGVRHFLDASLVLDPGATDRDPFRVLRFDRKTRLGPPGRRCRLEFVPHFAPGTEERDPDPSSEAPGGLVDRGPLLDEPTADAPDEAA